MQEATKAAAQAQLKKSLEETVKQKLERAFQHKILQAAQIVEQQVDAKRREQEEMSSDELERIREERIRTMQKAVAARRKWRAQGHGRYELVDESEFFQVGQKSERVVVHFFREATFRCKILDKHLKILAEKHIETLFIKVDVEKCPFLVQRLQVQVLPSMKIIRKGQFTATLLGFEAFGNCDEFKTRDLARTLAELEAIRELRERRGDGEDGEDRDGADEYSEEGRDEDDLDLELSLSA